MRKILLQTRYIDTQAERAAKRIATALDLPLTSDVKSAALSSLGELRIQIRDLQRQNLELKFLVENPGFDVDKQLRIEQRYVNRCFEDNSPVYSLYNRYDYEYFLENYHPGYVLKLCKLLADLFADHKAEFLDLWDNLIDSTGYLTSDIIDTYSGEDEVDAGLI